MPASLVERSAKAKAEKTGTTLEAVLTEWAGESSDDTSPAPASAPETTAPPDAPEPADAAPAPSQPAVTTDYLVQLAADAKRMPPKLILSSATARSTHSGASLHDVLADWAGVDLNELEANAATAAVEPASTEVAAEPAPEPAPDSATRIPIAAAAPVVAAGAAAMTMDELLAKVAEAKGMPASLAQRSAQARSKKTGEPVEAVLAEWAGVDPASVSAAPAEPEPTTAAPQPAALEAAVPAGPAADESDTSDDVEIIEAAPVGTSEIHDTDDDPPAKRGGYPVWLAAAFVLIPLLAVAYILTSPNGPDCGSGGQLAVDPVTGIAMNCDGSAYGDTVVDHFDAGGALYQQCVACHGADGSGGVGPAFTGGAVLATFPSGSCSDHIEWVSLGTAGWPDATYGANSKAVGGLGLMPAFESSLSEVQIAQVSLYERVQFGGEDLAEAELDCGLIEAEGETETDAGVEAGAEG